MATVYHAVQEGPRGFENEVAVKLVKPALVKRYPKVIKMLVDEARIASRVRHPNTVRILDLVEEEDRIYMIMDYVDGLSMRDVLDWARSEDEPPPVGPVLEIMAQTCDGLEAAHRATDADGKLLGLVHRDVKPGNVLVAATGDVKVGDFGIALFGDRFADATAHGQLKGTPAYMSPEQALSGPLDPRSDVFSAGLTLYTLVTSRLVFVAKAPREIALKIVNESLDPHIAEVDSVLEGLGPVLAQACAKDPDERYQSARELADALRGLHQNIDNPTSIPDLIRAAGWRPRGEAQQEEAQQEEGSSGELGEGGEASHIEISLEPAPGPEEGERGPEASLEAAAESAEGDDEGSSALPTNISQFGNLDDLAPAAVDANEEASVHLEGPKGADTTVSDTSTDGQAEEITDPGQGVVQGELLMRGEGRAPEPDPSVLDEPTQPMPFPKQSPLGPEAGFVPPPSDLVGPSPPTPGPGGPLPPIAQSHTKPSARGRQQTRSKKQVGVATSGPAPPGASQVPRATPSGPRPRPDGARTAQSTDIGRGRPTRDYRGRAISKAPIEPESTKVGEMERVGIAVALVLLLGATAAIVSVQFRGAAEPQTALLGVPLDEHGGQALDGDPFEAALSSVATTAPAQSEKVEKAVVPPAAQAARTSTETRQAPEAVAKPAPALAPSSPALSPASNRPPRREQAPRSAEPPPTHREPSAVPAPQRSVRNVGPAPSTKPPPQPGDGVEPKAVGTGTLTISTYPYSKVFIDGSEIGSSPVQGHELPAGKHQLRLVFPTAGNEEITETLWVRSFEETKVVRKLSSDGQDP